MLIPRRLGCDDREAEVVIPVQPHEWGTTRRDPRATTERAGKTRKLLGRRTQRIFYVSIAPRNFSSARNRKNARGPAVSPPLRDVREACMYGATLKGGALPFARGASNGNSTC